MSESLTRFPCGEFRPGDGPRPGGISDTVPPVFKPDPIIIEDPFDPDRGGGGGGGPGRPGGPGGGDPGGGGAPAYNKCNKQILYCPPPSQNKPRSYARTLSTCVPTFTDLFTASALYADPRTGKLRIPDNYDKNADNVCLPVATLNSFWRGCITETFQCITDPVTGGPTTGGNAKYWRCESKTIQCSTTGRGTAKTKEIRREKKPCTALEAQKDAARSGRIVQTGNYDQGADNLCIKETNDNIRFWDGCVTTVINNCVEAPGTIPPVIINGPTTPRYYMCSTTIEYCPSGPITGRPSNQPVKPKEKKITRQKVSCNAISAAYDASKAATINQTGPYDPNADNTCIRETNENVNFWDNCIGVFNFDCGEPPDFNSVSLPQSGGDEGDPRGSIRVIMDSIDGRGQRLSGGGTTQSRTGSIDNSQLISQSIINLVPTKAPAEVLNPADEEYIAYISPHDRTDNSRGLYDTTYNFFRVDPNVETVLVNNDKHLEVFNTRVAREIKYFLDRETSILAWHEQPFADLINDKIIVSLRYELLTAFNNIHSIGNTKVNLDYFIDMIRSHLYAGTISEFDPNFYIFIYNTQLNDPITEVPVQGETRDAIRAALAIFETKSKSPDFTQYSEKDRDDYKRTRFLLEDILANIPTVTVDGNEWELFLNNAGIPTDMIGASSLYTDIGDGAGYYVSAQTINESNAAIGFYIGEQAPLLGPAEVIEFTTNPGEEELLVGPEEVDLSSTVYPLVTDNEISSARYLEPIYNYQILKLLGSEISLTITASSAASANEFNDTYNVSADTPIMYFALNMQSIGDITKPNSVINPLSATYRRVTDAEASAHSRNYSFNIVRADIDFRDPIVSYARDTSTITVYQNDFNLRAFDENRTLVNNRIILRNIPAAIIVVPGLGSVHNPFNGRSRLTTLDQDVSVRSIKLSPSFDVNNNSLVRPPLNETNIFNTLGVGYFGEYEQEYDQDVNSNIFTYNPNSSIFDRTYYYNGSYSRERPTMTSIDEPIEKKVALGIVDKLASVSGVGSLTWWDVFIRLKTSDIGKLKLANPKTFLDKLADGWITNKKIKNVLGRQNPEYTGIPEGATVPDDLIIITEYDRTYIPNS